MTTENINDMPKTLSGSWSFRGGLFYFTTKEGWIAFHLDANLVRGFDPKQWERELNRLGRCSYLANSAALVRMRGSDTSRYQVNLTEDDTDPLVFTLVNPPEQDQ